MDMMAPRSGEGSCNLDESQGLRSTMSKCQIISVASKFMKGNVWLLFKNIFEY